MKEIAQSVFSDWLQVHTVQYTTAYASSYYYILYVSSYHYVSVLILRYLQLWAANTDMRNPYSLRHHQLINIGAIYRAKNDENLADLAQRFRADIRSLMVANPDIETKEHKLRDLQPICILPGACCVCVCARASCVRACVRACCLTHSLPLSHSLISLSLARSLS
jgi:hypothetical protein